VVSTVVTPGEWQCKIRTGGVRRLAVANGPNIFQMLLVYYLILRFNFHSWCCRFFLCINVCACHVYFIINLLTYLWTSRRARVVLSKLFGFCALVYVGLKSDKKTEIAKLHGFQLSSDQSLFEFWCESGLLSMVFVIVDTNF